MGRWSRARSVLRTLVGVGGGVLIVLVGVAALMDESMTVLERVQLALGTGGFALLAAGWGLRDRRAGEVAHVLGLGVFGLAMVAFVLGALPVPPWVSWAGLLAVVGIAVAVVVLGLRSGGRAGPVPEPGPGDVLRVPVHRPSAAVIGLLGLVMVAASLFVLLVPVVGWVVGAVGVAFFGWAGLWACWRAVVGGPALVAGPTGLEDRSSAAAFGRLTWSEVRDVSLASVGGRRCVAVAPRDLAAVARGLPATTRLVLALNRRLLRCDDLLVMTSVVDCSAADLARVLGRLHRRYG